MVTAVQDRLKAFPAAERSAREAVLETLVEVALEASLADLQRLKQGLARLPSIDAEAPAPAALAAARARNAARVLEERLRLERTCLPATAVMRGLGVSRQRLHQLRKAGRLVALDARGPRGGLYPAWQFGPDGRIAPGIERLIRAANEAEMGPATLHAFMEEPNGRLGGQTPADVLARGDVSRVVEVIRSSGLGAF